MLIGDSLMQYQFDALLAWQRRSGLPLRCRPFKQPSLISDVPRSDDAKNTRATRRRAAVRELLTKSRYDGEPQDCSRPGLQLMVRRLNLLPADDAELDHALNVLLAPLGERGVAVLECVFGDAEVANALGLAKLFLNATGVTPDSLMVILNQSLGKHIKANAYRYRRSIDGELAAIKRIYKNKETAFQLLWAFSTAAMIGVFSFISRMAWAYYGEDILAGFVGFQVE